jgi:hypothetical protein
MHHVNINSKPSSMKVFFILLWPQSMFSSCKWKYCSFGFMVNVNHSWWMGVLCGMGHVKDVL